MRPNGTGNSSKFGFVCAFTALPPHYEGWDDISSLTSLASDEMQVVLLWEYSTM